MLAFNTESAADQLPFAELERPARLVSFQKLLMATLILKAAIKYLGQKFDEEKAKDGKA